MGATDLSLVILLSSLLVAVVGVGVRVGRLLAYPRVPDPSPAKASARDGVVYAFTIGMLPWNKESARLRRLAYVRGVLFHVGIFTNIIVLGASLFVDVGFATGVASGVALSTGSVAGVIAIATRIRDRNLRAISRLDDYISPALVTLFLVAGLAFVLGVASRTVFWAVASIMCLYLPWSKVPHSIYFFFSRAAFGVLFGRRGILPSPGTRQR